MGLFFSNDNKFVSKEDDTKYKEEKYKGASKYQKIVEDKKNDKENYHDTYGAYRGPDGSYTEFYHGGNMTDEEKKEFGKTVDEAINNGRHFLGRR